MSDEAPEKPTELVLQGTRETENAEKPAAPEKPKLLFVDDEKSILDAMRRLCRTMKCDVFVAEGGQPALEIMAENEIDLVVSDMRMPEMTGAEFLEQVAEQHPNTIRILLTGYSDIESTIAAINQGKIYSYISKPWDNEQLKNLIDKALYTKRLEEEHKQLINLTKQQNDQLKELNESLEEKVAKRTAALQKTVADLDAAHDELKGAYLSSVEVFSRLIELREKKQKDQVSKVAEHVRLLSARLDVSQENTEQLYYAALLRNIGKMGLPDAALNESFDQLSTENRAAYKKHPSIGEALLMSVDALQDAANYIRLHCERLDGKGYPEGLTEEEIPLEARILCVTSDYDDLLSGMLIGAKTKQPEDAQDFLKSHVNNRYDKKVVDVYIEILAEEEAAGFDDSESLIAATKLKEGMTLSRDLITPEGLLLLSKNQELSKKLIDKILQFEKDATEEFPVYVCQ